MLETKAYRENMPELMDFIERYGKFLLVFSKIVGPVTGVGTRYAVNISRRATAGLIHSYGRHYRDSDHHGRDRDRDGRPVQPPANFTACPACRGANQPGTWWRTNA